MEHFISFIFVIAISLSAVSVAVTLHLKEAYHNRGALWFAGAVAGLGSFLIEILIWRYAGLVRGIVSVSIYQGIISFSNIWALAGGLLTTLCLPRFALAQTGAALNCKWKLFLWIPFILSSISGILFTLNIITAFSLVSLQAVIFSTAVSSVILIIAGSQGAIKKNNRKYFKHVLYSSVIFLPFIILDALGLPLPFLPEDLFFVIYVMSLCIVSLLDAKKLFGQPIYLKDNEISSYFFEHYAISAREKDVIELVLQGCSNQVIGDKLFISEKTVENHLTSIFRKTELKNRMQLFRLIYSSRN